MEEKKNNQEAKTESGCCGTSASSCCGGKKLIAKILLGLLLFGAGYWFALQNPCAMKLCPMMNMQK